MALRTHGLKLVVIVPVAFARDRLTAVVSVAAYGRIKFNITVSLAE
jgi:hypothetical protein